MGKHISKLFGVDVEEMSIKVLKGWLIRDMFAPNQKGMSNYKYTSFGVGIDQILQLMAGSRRKKNI